MHVKKSRKILSLLLTMALLINMLPINPLSAFAGDGETQIVERGGTRYYDKEGKEVTEGTPILGDDGVVVSVYKAIKEVFDEEGKLVENEFEITLEVETTVNVEEVKVPADAAVVLLLDTSTSMYYCSECGGDDSSNNATLNAHQKPGTNTNCSSRTNRLAAAKTAAKNFVSSYAGGANDAKRYIAVVSFDSGGKIERTWIDVSVSSNIRTVQDAIDNVTPAAATGMDAGLALARNLFRKPALDSLSKSGDIDSTSTILNRYAIVFSDGAPNCQISGNGNANYGNGVTINSGNANNANGTEAGVNAAVDMAGVIKNGTSFQIGGSSNYDIYSAKIYTIGYSTSSNQLATTCLDGVSSGNGYTFNADAENLQMVFNSISYNITSKAEAWTVFDPMGGCIVFNEVSPPEQVAYDPIHNTFEWDLTESGYEYDPENEIYTYKYKYRINLDTLADDFEANRIYDTNGTTTLEYIMVDGNGTAIGEDLLTAEFAVPQVKGFASDLSFTKQNVKDEELEGFKFVLSHEGDCGEKGCCGTDWSKEYTSANGGQVIFEDIPSGHVYKLTEELTPGQAEEYSAAGPFDISVLWGNTGEDFITDGVVVNNFVETEIEIEKEWVPNDGGKASITAYVYRKVDGEIDDTYESKAIELTPDNGWKGKLKVPTCDENGKTYTYYVEEIPVDGYTASYDGLKITNTSTETTSIDVEKIWYAPDSYADDDYPEVTFKLQKQTGVDERGDGIYSDVKDGEQNKTVTIKGHEKSKSFTGLPKYENGAMIVYQVVEVGPSASDTWEFVRREGNSADGYTFHNKAGNAYKNIDGEKTWVISEDAKGDTTVPTVPVSLEIWLEDDAGNASNKHTISPDKDGKWSYTFEDLPKYRITEDDENGWEYETITYVVYEENLSDWVLERNGNDLINTPEYSDIKTAVPWSKTWIQTADAEAVTFYIWLLQDEQPYENDAVENPVAVKNEENTEGVFTNLPKYDASGRKYRYTLVESISDSEVSTLAENAECGYDSTHDIVEGQVKFTNKERVAGKTEFPVTKIWVPLKNDNKPKITVTLSREDAAGDEYTVQEHTFESNLTSDEDYKYTFEDLDVYYDDNGVLKPWRYYVVESIDKDSASMYYTKVSGGYITNYLLKSAEVVLRKTFEGNLSDLKHQGFDGSYLKCTNEEHNDAEHDEDCYVYEFTFTLTRGTDGEGAPIWIGEPQTLSLTKTEIEELVSEGGYREITLTVNIGDLPDAETNTETYTIIETSNCEGWLLGGSVEVEIDHLGEVTYLDEDGSPASDGTTAASFVNKFDSSEYRVPEIKITKVVIDGRTESDEADYEGSFTFELTDGDGTQVNEILITVEGGTKTETIELPEFLNKNATLLLQEVIPSGENAVDGMDYDGTVYEITIENGVITGVVKYPNAEAAEDEAEEGEVVSLVGLEFAFANSYTKPITPDFQIQKVINHAYGVDLEFGFTWVIEISDAVEDESLETNHGTILIESGKRENFITDSPDQSNKINLPENFTGTVTVTENAPEDDTFDQTVENPAPGWVYDRDPKTLKYELGNLVEGESPVVFYNYYYEPSVSMTKSANVINITLGETIAYTLKVTNNGLEDLNNVQVTDDFFKMVNDIENLKVTWNNDELQDSEYFIEQDGTLTFTDEDRVLASNESIVITYDYTPTAPTGTEPLNNGATVEAIFLVGEDGEVKVSDSDEEDVYVNESVIPLGSLLITKFNDANNNGAYDSNEGPIANNLVSFTLQSINEPNRAPITRTVVDGEAEIHGLAMGQYRLTENIPSGYTMTTHTNPIEFTLNDEVSNNPTVEFTIGNYRSGGGFIPTNPPGGGSTTTVTIPGGTPAGTTMDFVVNNTPVTVTVPVNIPAGTPYSFTFDPESVPLVDLPNIDIAKEIEEDILRSFEDEIPLDVIPSTGNRETIALLFWGCLFMTSVALFSRNRKRLWG